VADALLNPKSVVQSLKMPLGVACEIQHIGESIDEIKWQKEVFDNPTAALAVEHDDVLHPYGY
jgi:hypothetical protein